MKNLKKLLAIAVIASGIGFTSSCRKVNIEPETATATGSASIYMRDAEGAKFDEVNVEIKEMQVYVEGKGGAGWHTVKTHAGVYNLLAMKSSQLMATSWAIPAGKITYVRIMTGNENTIRFHGESYKLMIDAQRGINVSMPQGYNITKHGSLDIKLDFDTHEAISLNADETKGIGYVLHPSVSVISDDPAAPSTDAASTK